MVTLVSLWLAILLSAVLVFAASSIIHMCLPIHKSDFAKLPNEEKVLEAMRAHGLKPGAYMFPCAGSMKDMATPEMIAKLNLGPVGHMTVMPNGPFNMGKSLVQWFLFSVLISIVTAYVGARALAAGASLGSVFCVAMPVSTMGYAFTHIINSIWKAQSWNVTVKFIFDGIVYGLVTALTFGWLWP